MERLNSLTKILIKKLITETDQPRKTMIGAIHYYEIENENLLNG